MPSHEEQVDLIVSKIITKEQKDQAKDDRYNESKAAWNSARLCVDLLKQTEGELSPAAVRSAVGKLYHKAPATIRRREKAAEWIPVSLVELNPDLGFSYFRVAVDYKGKDQRYESNPLYGALDVLDWIYDYRDDPERGKGELPTVATVDGWVYGDTGKAEMVWHSRLSGTVDQLDKIRYDKYAPARVRIFAGWVKGLIDHLLKTGESPLDVDYQAGSSSDKTNRSQGATGKRKEAQPM